MSRRASFALGPIPELGFVLQFMAIFGALGAIAAANSFERTRDADRRRLIATRWATFGLALGLIALVFHETVGVP